MKNFDKQMQEAFANRDPQRAAEIIGAAINPTDQQNRMDAAARAGFVPQFYGSGIRVWIDG